MKVIERINFSQTVVEYLQREIRAQQGREVFFLGRPQSDGLVDSIEAVAYGNDGAVNAVSGLASYGDIAVHNHPGGHLEPSEADMAVASSLAELGVGSAIINNDATRTQLIVKPFVTRAFTPCDPDAAAEYFAAGSLFDLNMDGFEERPEQQTIARRVSESFNDRTFAVVEAGTGIGKSFSYLVPAVLFALANNERVVVSTNTINLQEQLIGKDLPFLHTYMPQSFRSVLIKGRANYLCLRKLKAAREEEITDPAMAGALDYLTEWAAATQDGSRSDLSANVDENVWRDVCCESDQCTRLSCPHYYDCFYFKVRREAASANIIVVNHHLLFSDINIKRKSDNYRLNVLIPPFRRVIFDEAHNLEDVATSYFGEQFSRYTFTRNFKKVGRRKSNPLTALLHHPRLQREDAAPVSRRIASLSDMLTGHEAAILDELDSILDRWERQFPQRGEDKKLRITPELRGQAFWTDTRQSLLTCRGKTGELYEMLGKIIREAGDLLEEEIRGDNKLENRFILLTSVHGRLGALVETLDHFLDGDEAYCSWIEIRRNRRKAYAMFISAPIEVAPILKDDVYDRMDSIVFTSATLTVNRAFHYYFDRVGLNQVGADRLVTEQIDSPFDYSRRVYFGVPVRWDNSPDGMADFCRRLITLTEGGAFLLSTSYSLMHRLYERLKPDLDRQQLPLYIQGDLPNQELIRRFRETERASLLATMGFWEGIDIKGSSLRLLIITKLPFAVPTEPIHVARSEALTRAGRNAFVEYALPLAIIKFKQGFGRLMRSKDDHGVIIALDERLVSKPYGRHFLNSLPEMEHNTAEPDRLIDQVETFLTGESPAGRSP